MSEEQNNEHLSFDDKIKKILELGGFYDTARESIEQAFQQIKDSHQGKFREAFDRIFDFRELEEIIVPYYKESFSEEEIDKILDFYSTEAGRKMLNFNNNPENEMNESIQEWINEKYKKLVSEFQQKQQQ